MFRWFRWVPVGVFLFLLASAGVTLTGCAGPSASVKDEDPDGSGYAFSAKAILKKADGLFEDKKYLEAGQEYRGFLDLHPAHESAAYVQYRVGLCYFKQIHTADRDMDPSLKAMEAFQTLLTLYPQSPYVEDAGQKIKTVRNGLAEREFYVGQFYLKKKAYPAAIERFKKVLQDYTDSGVKEKTLYYLGLAYEASGQSVQAEESLHDLLVQFPDTSYKVNAGTVLSRLKGGTEKTL
jgi:outer membrane protein assembly factor BamD